MLKLKRKSYFESVVQEILDEELLAQNILSISFIFFLWIASTCFCGNLASICFCGCLFDYNKQQYFVFLTLLLAFSVCVFFVA